MNYRNTFLLVLIASFIYLFGPHMPIQVPGVPETAIVQSTLRAEVISPTKKSIYPAVPTHLSIPDAKVSADIIEVGVTDKGNLDVPPNYTEVGWYKYGKRPGETGSAVLDGHVDDGGKVPGPFKHLRDARIGDDIYVTMSNGSVLHYRVKASKVYDLNKFPGEMVFHETGDTYLKIITCHGKFVPSIGTYNQRLIVSAVLVQ